MSIPFFSKLRSQKHYLQLVKPELKQVSEFVEAQSSCFDPEVADYMETVCQSKGKMLRPALVLLVAGATGGIKPAHIRLGALLEMVHLASLVHDDVIDEADKRRDEATANALWGNSLAVLLGDVLFSHAMVLGTEFGSTEFCRRLANTVRNVCQGEVAQSSRLYDLSMTREEYFEIIRKKTASLFSAATGGAGWISGVTPEVEESLYQLGDLLGVAYQIYDDCLDMVGDEDDALALGGERTHDVEEALDLEVGEDGGGLVEDEEVCPAEQHLHDLDALLHADGDVLDLGIEVDLQAVFFRELLDLFARFLALDEAELRRLRAEDDVVENRETFDQLKVLVHHTDVEIVGVVRRVDMDFLPILLDDSGGRLIQTKKNTHQG